MAKRKRLLQSCSSSRLSTWTSISTKEKPGAFEIDRRKIRRVLVRQGIIVKRDERERFLDWLQSSVQSRLLDRQVWSSGLLDSEDIITLIQVARDAGDLDEAIWRSFLAAHFGRTTSDIEDQRRITSASLLLCGFGVRPKWTWKKASKSPISLRDWLYEHANDLQELRFGNHRKFESQKPNYLWRVLQRFIEICQEYGGPMGLVTLDEHSESNDSFDLLYRRLRQLYRFKRTGSFDFLILLRDLDLISAEPASCYLPNSTGPLKGAKRLWGNRGDWELERLAVNLAEHAGVSPIAVEDALCNWQK